MYVYGLGVIERHGTGDTNDAFVCDHRGDMQRLAAKMNELTAENAKLREQLAEANKRNSHLERFLSGVEAYHRLGQCNQCGAATFDGLICGVCRHDDSDD